MMASSMATSRVLATSISFRTHQSRGSYVLKAVTPNRRCAKVRGPMAAAGTIQETFQAIKEKDGCAFIPFICAGDPNLDTTEKALHILDEVGADIIELGVPYSDPLADGPTIQVRLGWLVTMLECYPSL